MKLEVRKAEKLLPIFIDIHGEQVGDKLHVEVTFALDPTVEALAAAFYMDGSASMQQSGNYGRKGLFGLGKQRNPVEEAMRIAVPYVAGKDANGRCRVAYWATGGKGQDIEVIGELSGPEAATAEFDGPANFGQATYLLPAVRDFVSYIQRLKQEGETIDAALAVVVTDGQFHDFDDARDYTKEQLVPAIMAGKFPRRTVFTVVGVGPDVDPEQMEELMHEATPEEYTGRPIWCYALADNIGQLPELVSHLIDSNTPAFWGGATVADSSGQVILSFEDMVPGVIEFELPLNTPSFTLNVQGQSYIQELELVEAEHGDDESEGTAHRLPK